MDVAATADIDPRAVIGDGSRLWHLVQVREFARIGPGCTLGRGVYIGPGVVLGRHCIVQDYAVVYEPALLEDGVFVGSGAVFTNDRYPRAITVDGAVKAPSERDLVGVTVRTGASIGAHAVCIAPLTIGRWAMVAAGAVVTTDVPDFALMIGAPAHRAGWVGRSGIPLLSAGNGRYVCPVSTEEYTERHGLLTLTSTEAGRRAAS